MTFYVRAVPMRVLGKWHIGRIRRRAVCFRPIFNWAALGLSTLHGPR